MNVIQIRTDGRDGWKIILKDYFANQGIYDHTLYFDSVTEAVGWALWKCPSFDIEYLDGSLEEYQKESIRIFL